MRYQRKKIGDDNRRWCKQCSNPSRESKLYSIESLAREIESIGSLSVEDVEHVMHPCPLDEEGARSRNKVKVDGLGIFYTTLTCPGVNRKRTVR